MTDQELKDLIASLGVAQAKTTEQINLRQKETSEEIALERKQTEEKFRQTSEEIARERKQTEEKFRQTSEEIARERKQTEEKFRQTSEEIARERKLTEEKFRQTSEEIARERKQTEEKFRQTSEEIALERKLTEEKFRQTREEIALSQKETARQIKQVNKQIGELGNKFGYFTEGMALPSMEKVLKRQFGLNGVFPRAKLDLNGETLEIDVLAHDTMGENDSVFLVEVKSNLTREAIEQLLDTIGRFPKFYPDLADRKLFGIVAAVYIPDELRNTVFKKGLYLARISDETFRLQTPAGFKPKVFGGNGLKTNGSRRKKKSK
jgi:hypothetical protein